MSYKDFEELVEKETNTKDLEWETNQCHLTLVNIHLHYIKDIYCLISKRKNNPKELVRFGTLKQVYSILKTYHLEKGFKL